MKQMDCKGREPRETAVRRTTAIPATPPQSPKHWRVFMSRLAAKIRCNYYPLPDGEADLIRSCMVFPEQKLSVLDPCAGEGRAMAMITASSKAVTYGIEL